MYWSRATSKRFVSGFSLFRIGSKYFQKISSSLTEFSVFSFLASMSNNSKMFYCEMNVLDFSPLYLDAVGHMCDEMSVKY